jgi:perosamine synthetase
MDSINKLAQEYDLYVIEDAAEAHGAEYKGKRVGSLGTCGAFSFYGNKIITTGEGGMITTNDADLYERAKFLRDHAMSKDKRYWHTEVGYNYRMTNIQAALGLAQLERIRELIEKRVQLFNWYKGFLAGIKNIRLNPENEWVKNVYWMICLVLDGDIGISREDLMGKLKEEGVDTRPFFRPMSAMPMYANEFNGETPVTYSISSTGFNLPSGPNLNIEDVQRVCRTLERLLKPA